MKITIPDVRKVLPLLLVLLPLAGPAAAGPAQHWVSTWGTAQQLAPMTPPRLPPAPAPAGTNQSPPRSPAGPSPFVPTPATLMDQTVRMIVRTTIGGAQVRVQFSNALGGEPVTIGRARIGRSDAAGHVTVAQDRALTFGGQPSVTMQPGTVAVSDPVGLDVAALQLLAVSIYLPHETPVNTLHALGLRTTFIAKGDRVADPVLSDASTNRSYFWLTGVEVTAAASAGAIVAFGDSITDGFATTPDTSRAWPELLAERLQNSSPTHQMSVINMGISGNRVRRDGAGLSALARFDRDVLARPGVKWVVLLEGINDINVAAMPGIPASEAVTADDLIAAYSQFVERAHMHGIKVMGGTILATEGLPTYNPTSEAIRQSVNEWIRRSGKFDAVADFDAATRDPARPTRLDPAFDPGDHVHPNDAGNAVMAKAIDIRAFID